MKARYFFKVIGITIFSLLLLNTIGMAQIHYDSTGNVGIGTTSPTEDIHIHTSDARIRLTGPDTPNGLDLFKIDGGGGPRAGLHFQEEGPLEFYTHAIQRMRITANGNVGIGTTNPAVKLDVIGKIKTDSAFAPNEGALVYTSNTGRLFIGPEGGTTLEGAALHLYGSSTENGGDFRVFVPGAGPAMVVKTTNGNVGIGTTSPGKKLHILDPSTTPYSTSFDSSSEDPGVTALRLGSGTSIDGDNVALELRPRTNNPPRGWISLVRTGDYVGDFTFMLRTGAHTAAERMRIDSSGNVGIGTTSPSRKLDVAGNVIANAYEQHSDLRLKKNIASIDNALDKILALRGVEFAWRTEEYPEKGFTEGREIGLIAQEVEQVIPEVVSIDNEGYKSVEYGNIVCVLIEAIKAQQARIEELEARIELLEQ